VKSSALPRSGPKSATWKTSATGEATPLVEATVPDSVNGLPTALAQSESLKLAPAER
jgi:hypothetical protein